MLSFLNSGRLLKRSGSPMTSLQGAEAQKNGITAITAVEISNLNSEE